MAAAGGQNNRAMSPRRRAAGAQFNQTSKTATTSPTNPHPVRSTGTSVAAIVLGDEDDDDVINQGYENTPRPGTGVDDLPTIRISPPDPLYAEVSQAADA